MNTNKTVRIRGTKYRLQLNAQTNWIFVQGKNRNSLSIGKIVDGAITFTEQDDALRYATNQELLNAFIG